MVFFNITVGLAPALKANRIFYADFMKNCVRKPLLSAGVLAGLYFILLNDAICRLLQDWVTAFHRAGLDGAVFALFCAVLLVSIGMYFARSPLLQRPNADVSRHYVAPRTVAVTEVGRRNLIVIQAESYEASFRDADRFGRNLLKPLDELPGCSFAGIDPCAGVTWTASAELAYLFGAPFYPSKEMVRNFRRLNEAGQFMPNVVGLGDILKQRGYTCVAMQGHPARFHNFNAIFGGHGFDRIYGLDELIGRRRVPLGEWGLFDEDLFGHALDELKALNAAGQNHLVYIVTCDTHGPRGCPPPSLLVQKPHPSYADVVEHSAEAIGSFIAALGDRGYLDTTDIAIIGDHPGPSGIAASTDAPWETRKLYNRFVSTRDVLPCRKTLNQFDIFPTLVEFAGFRVAGGRLGLGQSGFSPDEGMSEATRAFLRAHAYSSATIYDDFWRMPSPR
ncbi:MAG: LTA synthase family protein [Ancalomicrobiaceae bacterium]|nr:LTA synthase family protein [Ancalomicrobiaceae bacterium]